METQTTILIVDDGPVGRESLRTLLVQDGYTLLFADGGQAAVRRAQQFTPDVILLDVMMPGMDGFEVCRHLRADPRTAAVPIVIVTALDDAPSRLRAIEAGADEFVTKPFDRVELRARIRTIVRLNRYRRLVFERNRFEWAVEQNDDGFLTVDAAGALQHANRRARQLLGLPESGGLPGGASFLELARQTYHCEPAAAWDGWPSQAAGAAERFLVAPETEHGNAVWLRVDEFGASSAAIQDAHCVRLRDVSAQILQQQEVARFQQLVSHKLRTPLVAVLGGLDLLSLQPELQSSPFLADLLQMTAEGAARLHESVEDVIRYVTAAPHTAPRHITVADVESVVAEVSQELGLGGVAVSVPEQLHEVALPLSRQACQMLMHEILENSRKFHPSHTPTVAVDVSTAGGGVRVAVTDDGRTLPTPLLAQVWQPYYQAEKSFTGQVDGMGLGLSTVASLVWSVGGHCELRNRPSAPGIVVELVIPQRAAMPPRPE